MHFHTDIFRGVPTGRGCGRQFHGREGRIERASRLGDGGGMSPSRVMVPLDKQDDRRARPSEAASGLVRHSGAAGRAVKPGREGSVLWHLRRPLRAVAGALVLMAAVVAAPVDAQELQQPQGPIILTITGDISTTNAAGRADFDRGMLEGLPQVILTTTTSWTDGAVTFEGPLVRDVLALVEADGERVTATALNDYAVEIPAVDFYDYDVILALLMDGQPMSVRDKGPIWIVYPRDLYAELQTVEYNARWIWQLRSLDVETP